MTWLEKIGCGVVMVLMAVGVLWHIGPAIDFEIKAREDRARTTQYLEEKYYFKQRNK